MPQLATLVAIGSILAFVFTAIFTAFLGLSSHPRIAILLLALEIVTVLVALLFIEWKPRKRRRR